MRDLRHKYMLFRYATVTFIGQPNVTVDDFSISAWTVRAPFDSDDSYFSSSNATLNHVWLLCHTMLSDGVLDTCSPSNWKREKFSKEE